MAERERETVIYTDGGGGGGRGGSTALVAIVIVALLVVLFLVFGRSMLSGNSTHKINATVDINTPSGGGGSGNSG